MQGPDRTPPRLHIHRPRALTPFTPWSKASHAMSSTRQHRALGRGSCRSNFLPLFVDACSGRRIVASGARTEVLWRVGTANCLAQHKLERHSQPRAANHRSCAGRFPRQPAPCHLTPTTCSWPELIENTGREKTPKPQHDVHNHHRKSLKTRLGVLLNRNTLTPFPKKRRNANKKRKSPPRREELAGGEAFVDHPMSLAPVKNRKADALRGRENLCCRISLLRR